MDEKVDKHLRQLIDKSFSFRRALTSESDRGCALFAAAYLDVNLSDLLYVTFVEDKSIEKELFDGTAPLSSFSSRIRLTYYLGLISLQCKRDLDTIRSIRNDFAHDPEIISFSTQSIRDRCKNLSFSYRSKEDDPRSHFTAAVMRLLGHIHIATYTATPHTKKPDDAPLRDEKEKHLQTLENMVNAIKPGMNEKDYRALLELYGVEKLNTATKKNNV
jgi:DNA-binding MltR family transcriptional regulator